MGTGDDAISKQCQQCMHDAVRMYKTLRCIRRKQIALSMHLDDVIKEIDKRFKINGGKGENDDIHYIGPD